LIREPIRSLFFFSFFLSVFYVPTPLAQRALYSLRAAEDEVADRFDPGMVFSRFPLRYSGQDLGTLPADRDASPTLLLSDFCFGCHRPFFPSFFS